MAIRNIVQLDNPTLREKCKDVVVFDEKLKILVEDMKETMIKANGVGLAAPQVGILRRVCVISQDGKKFYELVNPVIKKQSGKQVNYEGCLSIPGKNGSVERPSEIEVEAYSVEGKKVVHKIKGFLSVIFCHEIDHLDGILFVDKMIDVDNEEIDA